MPSCFRRVFSAVWPQKGDRTVEGKGEASYEQHPSIPNIARMLGLSKQIAAETRTLEAYMRRLGLTDPATLDGALGDSSALPKCVQTARQNIVLAATQLQRLAMPPQETVRWEVWKFLDTLSLQLINHYDIASLVPLDGSISLVELNEKTSLDPVNLARVLRHSMTNGIFQEPGPGHIAHTAASRALATDGDLQAWVGFNAEENFPAAASVLTSLQTYPEASSFTRAGFNFAFDTVDKEPVFHTIGRDHDRALRMSKAMASLTGGQGYEMEHFVDSYDMSDINERGGTFVDLGGGHGFVSLALAKRWDKMRFVVQDLPKVIDTVPGAACDEAGVDKRVRFEKHDFLQSQPLKNADVYYFRWIFHNFSGLYAIRILKNLVPALKAGARVVINDHCVRPPGSEHPWDEKIIRGMDMVMLVLLNAQERDEAAFRALFEAADPGFTFKGVTRTEGCRMSVIEAIWDPKSDATDAEDSTGL